jgi:2-polyprenyl-3-methyl-5-hydroxy-6-metoxy-1,4-benzoquinol methylase
VPEDVIAYQMHKQVRIRTEEAMDNYQVARRMRESIPVEKVTFVQEECRGKNVLDLGCIRHSADFAERDPNWLHDRIHAVAKRVIGFDYLRDEVDKLQCKGYDIRWGDVTKPLNIDEEFDVIVAGDLIEHLSNFDGFFQNCIRLLAPGGVIVISTPNPFYTDEFHFVCIKREFMINPEHTCWIDPQALFQLASRYGFVLREAHYIRNSWKLKAIICDSEDDVYDILHDCWTNQSNMAKIKRKVLGALLVYSMLLFVP